MSDTPPPPVPPRKPSSVRWSPEAGELLDRVVARDGWGTDSLLIRTLVEKGLAELDALPPAERQARAQEAREQEADRMRRQRAANAKKKKETQA